MASSTTIRQGKVPTRNAVLQAALKSAEAYVPPPPRFSAAEAEAGVRRAQEWFQGSDQSSRDLVAELVEGRRTEVASE